MSDDPIDRFMQDVAANIRKARIDRGLTQVELGELIKTSKQYIYKIEMGSPLTLRTLISISLALKIPPTDLLKSNRLPTLHSLNKHRADKKN